jgi:hypothetical protein
MGCPIALPFHAGRLTFQHEPRVVLCTSYACPSRYHCAAMFDASHEQDRAKVLKPRSLARRNADANAPLEIE